MKHNDSNDDNDNFHAAISSLHAKVVKGQCVNVECPLSHTVEDNIDMFDGERSTKVQSWDTSSNKHNCCNSYNEDDSYFFEEDDPTIIRMQLNKMRKRGLIINNNIYFYKIDAQYDTINNSNNLETVRRINANKDSSISMETTI